MLHWHHIHTSNWSSQFLSYICTIILIKGRLILCKIRRTASSKSLKYLSSSSVASRRIHRWCSSNPAFWSKSLIIYRCFSLAFFWKAVDSLFLSLWPHLRGSILQFENVSCPETSLNVRLNQLQRLSLRPQWHCCWPKGAIRSHSPWVTHCKTRWLLTDELRFSCLFSKLTFAGNWSRIISWILQRLNKCSTGKSLQSADFHCKKGLAELNVGNLSACILSLKFKLEL